MTDCENTVLFFKLLICLLTTSQRAYEGPLRGEVVEDTFLAEWFNLYEKNMAFIDSW